MSYEALFSPFKVRGLELKNRIVLPGMNTKMAKNKHDIGEDSLPCCQGKSGMRVKYI